MLNLTPVVQNPNWRLQRAVLVGVLLMMLALLVVYMAMPEGWPCGAGCQSILFMR